MRKQSKLVKILKRASPQILAAASLIGLAIFTAPKESITNTTLKDGRLATLFESPFTSDGLYIHDSDSFPRAFYSNSISGLEYTDVNKVTRKLTERGYSVFNDTAREFGDLVPFSKDSTFKCVRKEYDDIINEIKAYKMVQARLTEASK